MLRMIVIVFIAFSLFVWAKTSFGCDNIGLNNQLKYFVQHSH